MTRKAKTSNPEKFTELLAQSGDRGWRLPSGLPLLDATAIRFKPGELTLVTGRTGHGKTHFLMNLLARWMEQPQGRFLYYSLEATPQALASRLKTMAEALRSIHTPLKQKLASWKDYDERLWLRYEPTWNIDQIAEDALNQASPKMPVSAIFVDPVTAVGAPAGQERDRRRDLELSYIMRKLKEMAHKLSCPAIACAPTRLMRQEEDGGHLRTLLAQGADYGNLEVEDAIRKRRPRIEHLPERGMEQEADLVLGLLNFLSDYQEELDPESRQVFTKRTKGLLELAALKNRFGALDSLELMMDFQTGLILDASSAR